MERLVRKEEKNRGRNIGRNIGTKQSIRFAGIEKRHLAKLSGSKCFHPRWKCFSNLSGKSVKRIYSEYFYRFISNIDSMRDSGLRFRAADANPFFVYITIEQKSKNSSIDRYTEWLRRMTARSWRKRSLYLVEKWVESIKFFYLKKFEFESFSNGNKIN